VSTRTLVMRVILGALVLLLVAVAFFSLRLLQRLPNTIIYFVTSGDTSFSLKPVMRHYSQNLEAQLKSAVDDLIKGPSTQETASGLFSFIPADTKILGLTLEGSQVSLNLSKAFTKDEGLATNQGRLYQVFYTLSQAKKINTVQILIEGQPLRILGGEGLMIDSPWRRKNRTALPVW
jgi:spore germination protein GerM